jgi:hypothetical protein
LWKGVSEVPDETVWEDENAEEPHVASPIEEEKEPVRVLPPKVAVQIGKATWTLAEAVAYGARLGEDEADRRGEIGDEKVERIARAKAYAAWEFDGKPASSEAQRKEFGVPMPGVTHSLEKLNRISDFKKAKKK